MPLALAGSATAGNRLSDRRSDYRHHVSRAFLCSKKLSNGELNKLSIIMWRNRQAQRNPSVGIAVFLRQPFQSRLPEKRGKLANGRPS